MQIYTYNFVGYEQYSEIAIAISNKLYEKFKVRNFATEIALNEAVINACKYSIFDISNAPVEIELKINERDFSISVKAPTKDFNVKKYRQNLLVLIDNPKYKNMDWGDYTGDSEKSRGFWYMLTACDYLYMSANTNKITLCISVEKFLEKKPVTGIYQLVSRFLIDDNGVIT